MAVGLLEGSIRPARSRVSGSAAGREVVLELAREDGGEKGKAGAFGFLAIDRRRAGQNIEPEAVDHGVEAAGDPIGLNLDISARLGQLPAEGMSFGEIAFGQILADLEILGPPAGFTPEGIPDRDPLS